MTSDRILALNILMRALEEPLKTYNRHLRKAWRTETDSPENLAARENSDKALLEIGEVVRGWAAQHPEPTPVDPDTLAAVAPPTDQTTHRDRIAESPTVTPNPDDGVILHLPEITYLDTQVWSVDVGLTDAGLRSLAAAVLAVLPPPAARTSAVTIVEGLQTVSHNANESTARHDSASAAGQNLAFAPPPADRAAVLLWAAEVLWNHPRASAIDSDFRGASDVLRRLAAEAQQPAYDRQAWETYRRDAQCACTSPDPSTCAVSHRSGPFLCACHRLSAELTEEERATLFAAEARQPETETRPVHAVPLPGSNGISACCGRPPCEFVGERVTRNPAEVTCTGGAVPEQPDDTDLTESDVDRLMAAGVPVQIVTTPPDTHGTQMQQQAEPHSCSNCEGIGPVTCLMNPNQPRGEQQPDTETRPVTPSNRRALVHNAISNALSAAGDWVPLGTRIAATRAALVEVDAWHADAKTPGADPGRTAATADPAMCPRCKGDNREAFQLRPKCAEAEKAARVAELEKQLAEYEPLNLQQCPAGKHADWLVDSEYAHACPWCEIDRVRDELAEQRTAVGVRQDEAHAADEVVAYRSRDGRQLRCLDHAPAQNLVGLDWHALTGLDVEGDANRCTEPDCHKDVLAETSTSKLVQAALEARAALGALCYDLDDPGSSALGALHLLSQATTGITAQPDDAARALARHEAKTMRRCAGFIRDAYIEDWAENVAATLEHGADRLERGETTYAGAEETPGP